MHNIPTVQHSKIHAQENAKYEHYRARKRKHSSELHCTGGPDLVTQRIHLKV